MASGRKEVRAAPLDSRHFQSCTQLEFPGQQHPSRHGELARNWLWTDSIPLGKMSVWEFAGPSSDDDREASDPSAMAGAHPGQPPAGSSECQGEAQLPPTLQA